MRLILVGIERNFTEAMEAAAKAVRPHEKPVSWDTPDDWNKGSWLIQRLEEAGFGNKVSAKSLVGKMEVETLEELVGNMMLFKDIFYKDYSNEELVNLKNMLIEVLKLKAFLKWDGGVGIQMIAWAGYGWK